MKLGDIYRLAIKLGIEHDPRGKEEVRRILDKNKEALEALKKNDREYFDHDTLENPYADTRILFGDSESEIKCLIAGIDMETQEIILADRLREKGEPIDLVFAHHPEGKALAALADVMYLQADAWAKQGVPINIGEDLIGERATEVRRGLMPVNHARAVDAARLLGFNYMCCHTPCDNLVQEFVQKYLDEKAPKTLDDVIKALKEIPEYKAAAKEKAGPVLLVGDSGKRPGRIVVDMTGGTEGPEGAMEKLADAGVGTLVGMHFSEKLRKKAAENHICIVVAGHIASDAIGMNLFFDELEKNRVSIVAASGFSRVKR
jgi:putative NIF3 family GTP cyclohydrolase 1 type 2